MADDRDLLKARFAALGAAQNLAPTSPNGRLPSVPTTINDTIAETTVIPIETPAGDRILLKIRRDQVRSMFGKVRFSVHFIAELSPAMNAAVKRYQLGKAIIYQKDLGLKLTPNIFLTLWHVFWLFVTLRRWRITIRNLVDGRTLTARNVVEMIETEDEIREAARIFARVLRAAANFGGEEIAEL